MHVVDQARGPALNAPVEQQRPQPISEDAERLYYVKSPWGLRQTGGRGLDCSGDLASMTVIIVLTPQSHYQKS